jgi:tetratricopeptide (TPR) repeat protein
MGKSTSKSAVEHVADFLLGLLPSLLLPKPLDAVAGSAFQTFRETLNNWLSQPRIRRELLEAARNAESEFRSQGLRTLKNRELAEAVASFPLFDQDLFQSTLASLPKHFSEEYLAVDLQVLIADDWKGKFTPEELREGVALYLNCLRTELLKVDGFADIVTRLATLRIDQRTDQILADVMNLTQLVKQLVDRLTIASQTTALALFTIPQPVTDFAGRETELTQLRDSFTNGAIITGVSGAGGIGKTELARKLAHDIGELYPAACMSIDLQGTSEEPLSSVEAMRRLLEPFYEGQKLPDDESQLKGLYQQTFEQHKALLLLDNASNAAQVRPLIPPSPSAAIITSRQFFSLSEFGLHEPLRLDGLSPEESREFLFSASGKLNAAAVEKVDQLANLCGHLPLALRVAVSLLNDRADWNLDTLIGRLSNERTRLQRLKRESDTDLDVEAAISLSYDLLPDNLKQRFRMLGAFAGPFWSHSVSAIWDSNDEEDVDASLGILLTRSLLNTQPGQFRFVGSDEIITMNYYTFHDLTHLFAYNRLVEIEVEAQEAIERHISYFLGIAALANDEYIKGHDHVSNALNLFRGTWHDVFTAWQRMVSNQFPWPRSKNFDKWISHFPIRCANMIMLFVRPSDSINLIEIALEAARRIGDKTDEASNLANLGNCHNQMGETSKAIELFEKSLAIARNINDPELEANLFGNLGMAYAYLGDDKKAIEYYQQALQIFRNIGNISAEGGVLLNMGSSYLLSSDGSAALGFFEKGLKIARDVGDHLMQSAALANIGRYYNNVDNFEKAIEYYKQALAVTDELDYHNNQANIYGGMGNSYTKLGDKEKAFECYQKQLDLAREAHDQRAEVEALINMGVSNRKFGNNAEARDAWEKAIAILQVTKDAEIKLERVNSWLEEIIIERKGKDFLNLSLTELALTTVDAFREKSTELPIYFDLISKMVNDIETPPETKELMVVLQQMLIGIKNLDLSKIPEKIAALVREVIGQ